MQTFPCRSCGREVTPDDCYRSLGRECKECTKERERRRRRTNPAVQEYDRSRAKRPERVALRAKINKEWRMNNPQAYKAQTAVGNALRDGKLQKEPCIFCEATDHLHAHHRDYSRPLDVIWVCAKCHHRLHAMFPELEGREKGAA